jgi:hypothetical protein
MPGYAKQIEAQRIENSAAAPTMQLGLDLHSNHLANRTHMTQLCRCTNCTALHCAELAEYTHAAATTFPEVALLLAQSNTHKPLVACPTAALHAWHLECKSAP